MVVNYSLESGVIIFLPENKFGASEVVKKLFSGLVEWLCKTDEVA
jgi:hypothetical protein